MGVLEHASSREVETMALDSAWNRAAELDLRSGCGYGSWQWGPSGALQIGDPPITVGSLNCGLTTHLSGRGQSRRASQFVHSNR